MRSFILFGFFLFNFLFVRLNAKIEVYDCFLFCNELDILTIRLYEMNEAVDKFVIVESIETFRGNPKPLHFKNNAQLFEKFKDKIIHVVVDQHYDTNNPWERESFQRNQIMRGLISCKDNDLIFISDVDEIVKKDDMTSIYSSLLGGGHSVVGVSHRYHSNFLNSVPSLELWRGTVITQYKNLQNSTPQSLRGMKDQVPSVAGGWHFSWVGGIEKQLYKLGAYSHAESDTPEMRASKQRGAEQNHLCPIIKVDESFPAYVVENQKYFEEIGLIYKKGEK